MPPRLCYATEAVLCHRGCAMPPRLCYATEAVLCHRGCAMPPRLCYATEAVLCHRGCAMPPRLCYATEAVPVGRTRKMFIILKVSGSIQAFPLCLLCLARMEGWCFWKKALLKKKTFHSPSNSSLLIIAREEYVIPSNMAAAFSP